MNKTIKLLALTCTMFFSIGATAQSLGSIVKSVASKAAGNASGSVANSVIDLLGTSSVSAADLVGTWHYNEPAVVLESSNVLSNISGSVATASVEKQMGAQLAKYGFTKGKVSMTFNSDNTFSMTTSGKTISGTYAVSGATLTLSRAGLAKVNTNVKKTGSTLQIAVSADKVLSLMNTVGSTAAKANSNIKTITTLLKQYKGMNMGMKFTK